MRKLSFSDIAASTLVVALVVVTLAPAVARLQRTDAEAKCQSNLACLARAVALYCADNSGRYPTNRQYGSMGALRADVMLSPEGVDASGMPYKFRYGITWVEALYSYSAQVASKTGLNWKSFTRCPNANSAVFPVGNPTARVSYAFNFNLLEYWSSLVRRESKVMMFREMDRLVNSVCRGGSSSNVQCYGTYPAPVSSFLTTLDSWMGGAVQPPINPNLHSNGSYIAFADGHVRWFPVEYYSQLPRWDISTQQWWNCLQYGSPMDKTIAISP